MKKTIKAFCILMMIVQALVLCNFISFAIDKHIEKTDYASYQEVQRITAEDLGYGITHIKTKAMTSVYKCNNQSSIDDSMQQVNILEVSPRKDVRVVNYTYPNNSGWGKKTLSDFVKSFEKENPGWVVIAGVNGDFYDINGKDKALPYHTTGTTVSDTNLLRAVSSKSIGYTNNGTKDSFKYTNSLTFTSYHVLDVYDEEDNIIKSIRVDKINELPQENETAVYYTYRENKTVNGKTVYDEIKVNLPKENSYFSENVYRCLPTSEPCVFAKGVVVKNNVEKTLQFGRFGIVTNNKELQELLNDSKTVRIQKQVTGDMADCDQIMAVGSTLIENGVVSLDNSDGMRDDRHPRTCVGVKADGTLMFFVIDGRQIDRQMYGMTQNEQGVMMKYYDCIDGFNNDGGGSTTMGIRNEQGEFVVVNSPSDGGERQNANALLVVVPELKLQMSEYTDKSCKLSYGKIAKGLTIENLVVTYNNETKPMPTNELIIDELTPQTKYDITYSYDITYKGVKTKKTSLPLSFTTGKQSPIVNATFDLDDENVNANLNIVDENNLITFASVEYPSNMEFLDFPYSKSFTYPKSLNSLNMKVKIDYSVESTPNRNAKIITHFTWYPSNLNKDLYYENELNMINKYIADVNTSLDKSFDEIQKLIANAKEEISKVKTKEEVDFENYKLSVSIELEKIIANKSYTKKNLEKATTILNDAVKELENATTIDDIDEIYQIALSNINMIKESSCMKASIVSILYALMFASIVIVFRKKK